MGLAFGGQDMSSRMSAAQAASVGLCGNASRGGDPDHGVGGVGRRNTNNLGGHGL
jgi:hypothetical protein